MQIYLQIFLFFMRDHKKLKRVEEVLPNDIRCRSEGRHRVEIGVRHPDTKGGVLLSERLSGGDGRDTRHRLGCGCRVDEDVLVVTTLGRRGHGVADKFAETELEEADEEGGC